MRRPYTGAPDQFGGASGPPVSRRTTPTRPPRQATPVLLAIASAAPTPAGTRSPPKQALTVLVTNPPVIEGRLRQSRHLSAPRLPRHGQHRGPEHDRQRRSRPALASGLKLAAPRRPGNKPPPLPLACSTPDGRARAASEPSRTAPCGQCRSAWSYSINLAADLKGGASYLRSQDGSAVASELLVTPRPTPRPAAAIRSGDYWDGIGPPRQEPRQLSHRKRTTSATSASALLASTTLQGPVRRRDRHRRRRGGLRAQ